MKRTGRSHGLPVRFRQIVNPMPINYGLPRSRRYALDTSSGWNFVFQAKKRHTIGWVNGFAGNRLGPGNNVGTGRGRSRKYMAGYVGRHLGARCPERANHAAFMMDNQSSYFRSPGPAVRRKNLIVAPSRALLQDSGSGKPCLYRRYVIRMGRPFGDRSACATTGRSYRDNYTKMPDGNFLVVGESICYRIEKM